MSYKYTIVEKDSKLGTIDNAGNQITLNNKEWYDDIDLYETEEGKYLYGLKENKGDKIFDYTLVDENGNVIKTDVAKKYTEKFEEIAIDEYQDSNLVQEYILTSVSKGNNIFMVGDVKQSIYRFRSACPEIFNSDKNSASKDGFPNLITLSKNFRSRKEVLDFSNLIFSKIMTEELGELNYTEEEYLNLGADYKDTGEDLKTEIDIITIDNKEDEEEPEELEVEVDENEDKVKILEQIALNRNCKMKGNELDYEKASKILLEEFRNGKLGKISLEVPEGIKEA